MSVKKSIKFAAPYTSATFNRLDTLLIGRNGVVTGGDVSSSGGVATIQPMTFVQNGLLVDLSSSISVVIPAALQAPYYIVVTTSSPVENIAEVITPTFAKRPQDVSVNSVLVAYYDGSEWIPTTRLQLNEIIKQISRRTLKGDIVGVADGLNVNLGVDQLLLPALVVDPGSLFDRQGDLFTKKLPSNFPQISNDIDGLNRVDQLIYRRPDDSVIRAGTLQQVVGSTFAPGVPYSQLHQMQVSTSAASKGAAKTIFDDTNTKYLLWMEDTGARAKLRFEFISDSATPSVAGTVDLVTGGITGFDVVREDVATLGVVYTVGDSLFYRKFSNAGAPLSAAVTIQTSSATLTNPKIVTVKSGSTYFLHVVFQEFTSNVVYKLFYTRLSSTATVQTTPVVLVDLTDKVSNPSIDKDDDDSVLYLVFENTSTGRIYLRQYLADTATLSTAPTQLGATLELGDDTLSIPTSLVLAVGGASKPVVKRVANKDLFVFWRQFKGSGKFGIGVYGNRFQEAFHHKAVLQDVIVSGETYSTFDVTVDAMNFAHLALVNATNAMKATLCLENMVPGVSAVIDSGTPNQVGIAQDIFGALVITWAFASTGFVGNGAPISPTQLYGPGVLGSQSIAANEVVILRSQYNALPTVPTVSDPFVVTGSASNNGTFLLTGARNFTDSAVNYTAIQIAGTFTAEAGSGSLQFQVPASSLSNIVKATKGVFNNLRGFYVTPTDIHLAYRTGDNRLAVAGPHIEETPTIARLYELFNSVLGATGQISWNVIGPGVLSSSTPIKIRVFNRVSEYTINNIPGLAIADGQIAYVVLPDEDAPATLPLLIVPFGDGILDRFGRRAVPIFWNIGGDLFIRFAPFRLSTDKHTVVIGESMSQQFVDFVGAGTSTPNPAAHTYLSTNYILQTDSHEAAIGKLDTEMAALASQIAAFLTASALEETQVMGVGGATIYNNAGFTWDADVSKPDIQVYVNGIKVNQDPTGALGQDFRKNSASQLEFSYTVPEGSKITVRKQNVTLAPAQEEEHVAGVGGTTVFNAASFVWDPSNAFPDIQVFINGVKQLQDQTGGLNRDFRKNSTTHLQFSYTIPQGSVILVRLERNNSGSQIAVSNQGSPIMGSVTSINFVGAGVTATAVTPTSLQVNIAGAGGGVSNLQKSVFNNTGVTIPAGAVVSWLDDGTVQLAEADVFVLSDFAGITVNAIPNGAYGTAVKGGNAANILTGLGAIPGQDVYLSVTPGGLTLTAPGGLTDTVYKIGRAEPPTGFASPTAVDLYLELDVVSTP